MALSYKDSMKRIIKNNVAVTAAFDSGIAVHQEKQRVSGYEIYEQYSDAAENVIDISRQIRMAANQTILTQDSNLQYLYFKMFRYYDGVDQATMKLKIHALNPDNYEIYIVPVNVSYDDEYLYFGVILDQNLCAKAGVIRFEVGLMDKMKKQGSYRLITKAGSVTVEQSLSDNGEFVPPEDRLEAIVNKLNTKADNITISEDRELSLTSDGKKIGTAVDVNPPVITEDDINEIFEEGGK